MQVEKILKIIRDYYQRTGRIPKTRDLKIVEKECSRRVGSWRKALWLSGIIEEERKKRMPRLNFVKKGGKNDLDAESLKKLKRLKGQELYKKDRLEF